MAASSGGETGARTGESSRDSNRQTVYSGNHRPVSMYFCDKDGMLISSHAASHQSLPARQSAFVTGEDEVVRGRDNVFRDAATQPGIYKSTWKRMNCLHISYSEGGGMTQPGCVVRQSVALSGKQ